MLQRLFRWANILLILLTLLMYLAPYIHPATFWWLSGFSLFYPLFLLLHLCFIGGWLMVKHWYFLMSLGCLIVGFNHFQAFVGYHFFSASPTESDLHVISYNIYNFRKLPGKSKTNREKDYSTAQQFFKAKGPVDILLVQESANNLTDRMGKLFDFPHRHTIEDKGVAILSKHPIIKKGQVPFKRSYNAAVWADIKLPSGGKVRVYSIHLQSNRVSEDAQNLAENVDLQEKETWQGIKGMFRKYKAALLKRAEQAELVAEHMAKSPHPVIVGADLNDTPQSFAYHQIINARSMQDAFAVAGRGFGTTYAGAIPALRIDYIFSETSLPVMDHHIYKEPFSDHYAVSVKFGL